MLHYGTSGVMDKVSTVNDSRDAVSSRPATITVVGAIVKSTFTFFPPILSNNFIWNV